MKNYKIILVIPVVLFIISVGILAYGYTQTGDWFAKSIELKGGTQITIIPSEPADLAVIEGALSGLGDFSVKEQRSFSGQTILISTSSEEDSAPILKALEDAGVDISMSSTETIGSSLGEDFWQQAQTGIIIAFILMGIIVFGIFRKLIPGFAVMMSPVSDIVVTFAIMQLIGVELSLAGFAAILMLIGYSIDTDILLTTRLLRGSGPVEKRIRNALKTGLMMSFTTMGALAAILLFGVSPVLSQIALVLLIGLMVDIVYTWTQNSVLLRWYCERSGMD